MEGKGGMILTVTDFGVAGPYLAQMHAAARLRAPDLPVLDLVADLPAFQPLRSAYLLAALAPEFPAGSAFCCVVDPGVGSDRQALIVQANFLREQNQPIADAPGLPVGDKLAALLLRARTAEAGRRLRHLAASADEAVEIDDATAARMLGATPVPIETYPDTVLGELALDGSVRPVRGVLPIAVRARDDAPTYGAARIMLRPEDLRHCGLDPAAFL